MKSSGLSIHAPVACFRDDLESRLDISYQGDGRKIALAFYIPVLQRTKEYHRTSGYFNVDSLVVNASGLDGLIHNAGKMKLVLGAHDVGPELRQAYVLSRERAADLVREIGDRITLGLERVEDLVARKRLEFLAWMLVQGTLQVKVAMPRRTFLGLGNGIFHEKALVFEDNDGHTLSAVGSANETRPAYDQNGESLTIHCNWRQGQEIYVARHERNFESLWNDAHPDYVVFPLPEAVDRKLRERFYPREGVGNDPYSESKPEQGISVEKCRALVPAARLVSILGNVRGLAHLGLGPIRPYPHQAFAADFVLSRFPHRVLLADEVGLGKTIEAGAAIKRLVDSGRANRILIMAPKNVAAQWLDELWDHFGLRFWLFETNPRSLLSAQGDNVHVSKTENPFDLPGYDRLVVSWHYARGSRRREPEILRTSNPFDLVVVDEAHNARKKRFANKVEPTRLNDLCMELSIASPHVLLVTATPVQLRALEAHDLLRILGLGGPWVHEAAFARYFEFLATDLSKRRDSDWEFALPLAAWVATHYLDKVELPDLVHSIFSDSDEGAKVLVALKSGSERASPARQLARSEPAKLNQLLIALSPVQWFMVRNTRKLLEERTGFRFPERDVKEEAVALDSEHDSLLKELDGYLRQTYGLYERLISENNRGILGFVRTIYHQRFVSSFTAAYETVRTREAFLAALLNDDEEAILRLAEKTFEEVTEEEDEEDLVDVMRELLATTEARDSLRKELEALTKLESRLRPYAADRIGSKDPKMKKVVEVVDDLLRAGRSVLVFSKYTDTVSAVVTFLHRKSTQLSRSALAIYTGSGGQIYDLNSSAWRKIPKKDVVSLLEEGKVKVIVCSEAASEGLNLQAASAVVNVDMPWNPAKVEQRIGRVDRLGQEAPIVVVRNVWYPGTIEAQMYRVLFERKTLYQAVIGPAQEIISEGLRKALDEGARGARLREVVEETLRRVDEVKEQARIAQAASLGAMWGGKAQEETELIESLVSFCLMAAEAVGIRCWVRDQRLVFEKGARELPEDLLKWGGPSLKEGKPNALTFAHPIVQWLCAQIAETPRESGSAELRSLYAVKGADGLFELVAPSENGGATEILGRNQLFDLLQAYLLKAREMGS